MEEENIEHIQTDLENIVDNAGTLVALGGMAYFGIEFYHSQHLVDGLVKATGFIGFSAILAQVYVGKVYDQYLKNNGKD